jgi:hypothetical protein
MEVYHTWFFSSLSEIDYSFETTAIQKAADSCLKPCTLIINDVVILSQASSPLGVYIRLH